MKKVVGVVIGLLPVSAFGECVPVPDCASIGYTETSCDGGSVKCPFDTTKLKCIPCDSSFRYSCDGENVTGAVGDACNNKYVACNCMAGTIFINGECVCDTSCSVGNIYYSDGTCSSCVDESKTPVGIVVKNRQIIMAMSGVSRVWSSGYTNIPLLEDFSSDSAKESLDGKKNTKIIIDFYKDDVNQTTDNNAAMYCYNYAPDNMSQSKGQWYLPTAGEIYNYGRKNIDILNTIYSRVGLSVPRYVNTSTESPHTYGAIAYIASFKDDNLVEAGKYNSYDTYCFYMIN